jgi:hypothetical protein
LQLRQHEPEVTGAPEPPDGAGLFIVIEGAGMFGI